MRFLIVLFFVILSLVVASERDTDIDNGIAEVTEETVKLQDFSYDKMARKDIAGQVINKTIDILSGEVKTTLNKIIEIFG
uniref:Uncharacterized protein n=1 Tax=Caenorhabditis japonica TaxID=281687 RepID=A0A8R1I253_CAEJA